MCGIEFPHCFENCSNYLRPEVYALDNMSRVIYLQVSHTLENNLFWSGSWNTYKDIEVIPCNFYSHLGCFCPKGIPFDRENRSKIQTEEFFFLFVTHQHDNTGHKQRIPFLLWVWLYESLWALIPVGLSLSQASVPLQYIHQWSCTPLSILGLPSLQSDTQTDVTLWVL